MKEGLSVIIPAHNCAKVICRAIRSILGQDYENIELIIVENGSSDDTYEVCRGYAEKDSRCVVLKNEEASTLLARKTGIEFSNGDYITFCDADDEYANADSLRKMVNTILRTGADIVQFGNFINRFGKRQVNLRVDKELIINRDELLQTYIAGTMGAWNQVITPTVWSKIYRGGVLKAVADDLSFQLINAEDVFLNCNAFFCGETEKVAFAPLCEYVYYSGSGVTGKPETPDNLFREYEVLKIRAYELARQYHASENCIYLSQRETLRFLDNLIKSYIIMGDSKPIVCSKISEWWSYEHVKLARSYFAEYEKTHELDEEMHTFSSCSDTDRYYEYCLQRICNLPQKRMRYKAKQTIKQIYRMLR